MDFSHIEILYIAQYGYVAFFLIIFLSELVSFPPIGVLIIGMGALAHAGYYNLVFLLIVSTVAVSASDYIIFSIAHHIGTQAAYRRYVRNNRFAGRIESYMGRHPILTILLTRFVGILTTPTNAIAGLSQVSRVVFVAADLAGNTLWCLVYLLVGYLLAAALKQSSTIAAASIGVVVLGILVGYGVLYFVSRTKPKEE